MFGDFKKLMSFLYYSKSVALQFDNYIAFKGVPFAQQGELYSRPVTEIPATIRSIFPYQNQLLVLYHKGVSEVIVSNYNCHEKADRDELEKFKQYYFAIYDMEFNLL